MTKLEIWKRAFSVTFLLCLNSTQFAGERSGIDADWLVKAQIEVKAVLLQFKSLSASLDETSEVCYAKAPGSVGKAGNFSPHNRRDRTVRLGKEMYVEQIRTFDDDKSKPSLSLRCDNELYHFSLGKSKVDSSYALVDQRPGARKVPLVDQGGFALHIRLLADLDGIRAALDKDPKFTLKLLRFDEGKRLLRIEYTQENGAENRFHVDPAQNWQVMEYWVETPYLVSIGQVKYGATVGGLTFPVEYKHVTTYKVTEAPPNMEVTSRLISLKLTDKTARDFRLTAFDLPEPMGMPPVPAAKSRWYLWIGMSALGFLLLGGIFWRASRYFRVKVTIPNFVTKL